MDKLLKLIDQDGKLTAGQLAAMLSLSEKEVSERLEKFEKNGTLKGTKAIINWEKVTDEYVTALIELKVTPKRDLGFDGIAREIAAFPNVESVYLMSGAYDLSVTVTGKSFQEIAMFVASRLSTIDSVQSTSTCFVLKKYKHLHVDFCDEQTDERGSVSF